MLSLVRCAHEHAQFLLVVPLKVTQEMFFANQDSAPCNETPGSEYPLCRAYLHAINTSAALPNSEYIHPEFLSYEPSYTTHHPSENHDCHATRRQ